MCKEINKSFDTWRGLRRQTDGRHLVAPELTLTLITSTYCNEAGSGDITSGRDGCMSAIEAWQSGKCLVGPLYTLGRPHFDRPRGCWDPLVGGCESPFAPPLCYSALLSASFISAVAGLYQFVSPLILFPIWLRTLAKDVEITTPIGSCICFNLEFTEPCNSQVC